MIFKRKKKVFCLYLFLFDY